MINITSLKSLVRSELPHGAPLREVVLAERDELTEDEYLLKTEIWLKLLRSDYGKSGDNNVSGSQ